MIRLLLLAGALGAIAVSAAAQISPPPPEYRACEYAGQDRCVAEGAAQRPERALRQHATRRRPAARPAGGEHRRRHPAPAMGHRHVGRHAAAQRAHRHRLHASAEHRRSARHRPPARRQHRHHP